MISESVIEVERLTKRFGEVTAVDDLSFSAQRGEILGLLGPNGAGKTTTIQLLLGLTRPTSGRIRILGMDLSRRRREILQRANFSSAYISLPFNLSVRENLDVFGRLYGVHDRKRYFGDDTPGDASKLHFPSYGEAAAGLLVRERRVGALGVDTASIDHGPSTTFPVHRLTAAANVPGLENLTGLESVPERGAWIVALPMKIAGGSGGPLRAVALVP